MSNNQKLHNAHYLYLFDRNKRLDKEKTMLLQALKETQETVGKLSKELKDTQFELMMYSR